MPSDPFDTLGLPAGFDLDPSRVERAYLARAARTHPDAAGSGPEAGEGSADLNLARETLLNPEARAEALLGRLGGPAPGADRSLPPGFLQEMMSTREEIEAAVASEEDGAIEHWVQWSTQRRLGHIAAVTGLFASVAEEGKGNPGVLREIRRELNVWRYTERLIEQLDAEGDAPAP